MREGAGSQKGELLAVQTELWKDDLVQWKGHGYPRASTEGLPDELRKMVIPDAFTHDPHLLPHEHADLDGLFPVAAAAPAMDDKDPPEYKELEEKGIMIGKRPRIAMGGQSTANANNTNNTTTTNTTADGESRPLDIVMTDSSC